MYGLSAVCCSVGRHVGRCRLVSVRLARANTRGVLVAGAAGVGRLCTPAAIIAFTSLSGRAYNVTQLHTMSRVPSVYLSVRLSVCLSE